jgi:hypothetical protein
LLSSIFLEKILKKGKTNVEKNPEKRENKKLGAHEL